MAYSTNTQVETLLGLEAGTLTTAQDIMITAMIALGDSLIDLFTDGQLAGTEDGLDTLSAALAAHLYKIGIEEFWNPVWRAIVKEQCMTYKVADDAGSVVQIADMVDPFDEDED